MIDYIGALLFQSFSATIALEDVASGCFIDQPLLFLVKKQARFESPFRTYGLALKGR